MLMRKLKNKKGFTLIELIVVIAILAILAMLLIPRFSGFRKDAVESTVLSEARSIQTALAALETQGKALDDANLIAMLGKAPGGTVTYGANADNWSYVNTRSGFTTTVTCAAGVLTAVTAP